MPQIDVPNHASVLVSGAGPCGMTAALTLRRAGCEVVIVDKAAHTREHSQAAILWPRTLEVLDLLGIVGDWAPHTTTIHAFTVTIDDHAATLELHPVKSPHPQPQGVGQDITEAILEKHLKASGALLIREAEVMDVSLHRDGVSTRIRLGDGTDRVIDSDWIIGCEGSESPVRKAAGIERSGSKNAGVQLVQGDVRIRGPLALAPGHGFLWSDIKLRAMFMLPTHVDGHYRVLVAVPEDGNKEPPTLEQLQNMIQEILPDVEVFDPLWLNRFRTQHQLAETYRAGRAFLAGDSAHIWVPIGGQGMNIGMQDAFDIGWKLGEVVAGRLKADILDTYTAERLQIGSNNISNTEQMYGALVAQDSIQARIERRLVPLALGSQTLESFVVERFAEVDLRYPSSAIVVDHGHTNGPRAGQRAPDAWVTQATSTVRLYDLYRPGRWLVIGWAISDGDDAVIETLEALESKVFCTVLVDATRHGVAAWQGECVRDMGRIAAEAFGVTRPSIHVIRPDGIIGYCGGAALDPLMEYLTGSINLR